MRAGLREAIRAKRRDKRVNLARQDLARQQPPDERPKRNPAVRYGLVVAWNSRESTHARMPVSRNRTPAEPRLHDLGLFQRGEHPPSALQKLRHELAHAPGRAPGPSRSLRP